MGRGSFWDNRRDSTGTDLAPPAKCVRWLPKGSLGIILLLYKSLISGRMILKYSQIRRLFLATIYGFLNDLS